MAAADPGSASEPLLYTAFGLAIRSEFPLPELIPGDSAAQVQIERAPLTPPELEATGIRRQGIEARFGGSSEEAYLRWPGVATLLARRGRVLQVHPDPEATDARRLNLYILSEALGILLHQRGCFLLHGSAVKIADRAILFAGRPGVGKSTTAAAFRRAGHTVLADDMVAVDFDAADRPTVLPAYPQLKIWPSAVEGLRLQAEAHTPLFPGSAKRVMRDPESFPTEPVPLTHVIVLHPGPRRRLEEMVDAETLLYLTRFFPCPSALVQGDAAQRHFAQCARLLREVYGWKLEYPKRFDMLDQIVDWVGRHLDRCPRKSEFRPTRESKRRGRLLRGNSS